MKRARAKRSKKPAPKAKPSSRRAARPLARLALRTGGALLAAAIALAACGVWYVHHPRSWRAERERSWPRFATAVLRWIGGPVGDFTDAIDLTGHDAVYEYDVEAPEGSVFFAGAPRRISRPAPEDIIELKRGEFVVGWSPGLRHPVWVAYHVPAAAIYKDYGRRPSGFVKDREAPGSPASSSYAGSNYDRGHMAPNHAIFTRFGEAARRLTFQMTNVAPQAPALNRGVWRDIEHRISDEWTACYGEIWVIVGCIASTGREIAGTGIDIPEAFYQVVVAQTGYDVRAFAVIFPQDVSPGEYPASGLISIDELEELSGLDFFPELASFLQRPLEAELPTRVWPVGFRTALRRIFGL